MDRFRLGQLYSYIARTLLVFMFFFQNEAVRLLGSIYGPIHIFWFLVEASYCRNFYRHFSKFSSSWCTWFSSPFFYRFDLMRNRISKSCIGTHRFRLILECLRAINLLISSSVKLREVRIFRILNCDAMLDSKYSWLVGNVEAIGKL